jgi:hypothetical protein
MVNRNYDSSAESLRQLLMERYPDHFMAFADLFAMGCLLHLQGQRRAGRKLIDEVRAAVAVPGNKTYLCDLIDRLAGNELRFASEIQAHLEVNELLDVESSRRHDLSQQPLATHCGGQSMTKQAIEDRIRILSSEMDANEEENRQMQEEIDALYARIDTLG